MLSVGARDVEADRPEDFIAVVGADEGPLARYLHRLVGDPQLARDLMQDTFLSAYRAWPPADEARLRRGCTASPPNSRWCTCGATAPRTGTPQNE